MQFKQLVVLALASTVGASRLGVNNKWFNNARISAQAEVNDCNLKDGVQSLNLAGKFETDLNDETVVSVEYDYNDLQAGELPRDVNVRWNSASGGTNYGVDADVNLHDKSATAEISMGNGDLSVTANVDSTHSGYLTGAEASYNLELAGKDCRLKPSWDCKDNNGHLDIEANINADMKAEVGMDLNGDGAATIRVDYALNADNSIAPTFNVKDQSMSFEVTRRLSDNSQIEATVEPNKNVAVEWQDAGWTTKMNVPWGNAGNSDISFKRSFDL